MKLLVFGKTGQLARELARCAPNGMQVDCVGRDRADLADPANCAALVAAASADAVINAAAYTAVDAAEADEPLATRINGEAPAAMARAAADRGLPFLQVSTDYVFDGSGDAPWTPDAAPAPLNAYGRSKLEGEAGVRVAGGPHGILRTAWVFSGHGQSFVSAMLRLAQTRNQLNVVADQVGGPTPATDLAQALLTMAAALVRDPGTSGTYHDAGWPEVTRADFARAIFAEAGSNTTVTDIPSTGHPTPAKRPLNSRLDCSSFCDTFGLPRPDWRTGLAEAVAQLKERVT